jgi:filamentous hemagglutinin family protein
MTMHNNRRKNETFPDRAAWKAGRSRVWLAFAMQSSKMMANVLSEGMKGVTLNRGFSVIVLLQLGCFSVGYAQVVLDGKFGTTGPAPKVNNNYDLAASLGKTVGNNLFQSFSQFDLVNGEAATFSGPANIQNILSRVTGANASSIDGTIRSTIDGANMFFMNPNGVMFGPNAQLDVKGSFVATSANYIKLSDGARFVASLGADDSVLSTAPVSAFGFLGSNPGSISVQQSALNVPNEKSFSIIGGDVSVDGGTVQATSGRINLVSVKSVGEVPLDVTDPSALPNTSGFPQQGRIDLLNGAKASTSGSGGGQVVIRGGRLVMNGGSIQADTSGSVDGKGVDAILTEDLTMSGGAIMSASTGGSGNAGSITVTANSIELDGENLTTGILADSISASGKGGSITVTADSLDIRNGARISSAASGPADGGSIFVTADSIVLDSQGSSRLTGIAVSTLLGDGGGDAGRIVVQPGLSGLLSLRILNGAVIAADTFGTGNGGEIDVTASSIRLDMQSSILFTGIRARTFREENGGRGGDIKVITDTLDLFNGAEINVQSRGSGAGGNINITADSIGVNSSSKINADTDGLGPGGSIILTANSLRMDGNAQIVAANDSGIEGDSPAGDITIRRGSSGGLSIDVLNGSEILASSKGASNGGKIDIEATTLTLDNNAGIRTSTIGSGLAGDIKLRLDESLTLQNQSALSASAAFSSGGNIDAEAGSTIQVFDSDVSALADLLGGNVTLKAGQLVHFLNSTLSAQSISGNGGNITIDPPFVVLNQSQVNASAPFGQGGDITIISQGFLGSDSIIDATGLKNGVIEIQSPDVDLTGSLIVLPGSLLGAESQLRPSCGIRLGGEVSSFVVLGRGGAPIEPNGPLPSFGPVTSRGDTK